MNVVIDANVLAAANFHANHISASCIEACIRFLIDVQMNGGMVSIDKQGEILQEYARYCNHKGEPNVGDAFFKWLFDHQGYAFACEMVAIHPNTDRGYEEFPADITLEKFDLADRKYVAVAIASAYRPEIHNATDSDWSDFQSAFQKFGIMIHQHCPRDIR